MKNQLALSLLKGGHVLLDQFRGKREVAGPQIEQRGHVRIEQQVKGIGVGAGEHLNLFAPQGGRWPLRGRALNDAEPHTEGPYGFCRGEACEFFESGAGEILNSYGLCVSQRQGDRITDDDGKIDAVGFFDQPFQRRSELPCLNKFA
jgi:hypothetical protein